MSNTDLPRVLQAATAMAAAAETIAKAVYREAVVSHKADDSEVTEGDFRIQRLIAERVHREFPDHAMLGEEEDEYLAKMPAPDAAEYCWVADPIDGTRNYTRHLPTFCGSIAVLREGVPVVAVIREYVNGATYTAIREQGAFCGDRKMQVAQNPLGRRSIVSFQADHEGVVYERALPLLREIHLRNLGTTAMHLALMADGAIDAGACLKCRLWDIAAGSLLLEEAGGIITDWTGAPVFPFSLTGNLKRVTPFLAASKAAHKGLLKHLKNQQP